MPLGKQFDKTFYNNPTAGADGAGETQFFNNRRTPTTQGSAADDLSPKPAPGNYQGMFFHPDVATGTKHDPSVDPEYRRGLVQHVLNIKTNDDYRNNIRADGRGSSSEADKMSDKKAAEHRGALTDAGYESGIPNHMFEKMRPVATSLQRESRTEGGHYYDRAHTIRLNNDEKIVDTKMIPGREEPITVSGAPIPNPKINDVLQKHFGNNDDWSDYYGRTKIMDAIRFKNPDGSVSRIARDARGVKNGNITHFALTPTIVPAEAKDEEILKGNHYMDEEGNWGRDKAGSAESKKFTELRGNNFEEAPEMANANLYEGHAKDTKAYRVQNLTVEGRKFHTRSEVVDTGRTRVIPNKMTYTKAAAASTSTLVHELGHANDQNTSHNYAEGKQSADPTLEGTADGYRDRHNTYADSPEEHISLLTSSRQNDFRSSGYGPGHFANPVDKALYVASRQHVATGGEMPNRQFAGGPKHPVREEGEEYGSWSRRIDKHYKERQNHIQQMTLGYLYSKNEHVRNAVDHFTGDAGIGPKAAEYYRSQVTDAGRSSNGYQQQKWDF
ncbi:hypothetical protein UFOVP45_124 [uncultured Caudovirales phage]|uniref:Uncharacterized protein n=1 Tax=uncultured Caudovirales phage TaxID=2100421 RepID=A0A6J5KSM3_9CAUD|nr:hypothetical protein UFOVP45_124 [uncultured Caudovirales phage]